MKRLYRDESNKVFGGVFAGLNHYLGWNTNIMRFFYVLITLSTYFWPMLIIYCIAWMIIPAARSPRQILEMTGTPITVSNVGQTILGTPDPANVPTSSSNVFNDIFSVLGKVFLAIFGAVGAAIGIGAIIGFVVMLCSVIMLWGWHEVFISQNIFGIAQSFCNPWIGTIGGICLSVAIFLPAAAAVWAGCNALFNVKAPSKGAIITLVIIEILMIIASVVLLQLASTHHIFAFASTAATTSMTCIS
ncbi:MAG: PspC domain-containing protein [Muribaculaceae bacterium]